MSIVTVSEADSVAGEFIPQHRLLSHKEWRWIKAGHRYGYWSTLGSNEYAVHCDLHHVDPVTERLITYHPRHRE